VSFKLKLKLFFSLILMSASSANIAQIPPDPYVDWTYNISSDGNSVEITGCTDCWSDISIPDFIDLKMVTSIADRAFYNSGLTSVNFEFALFLSEIGEFAFAQNQLTSVTLPLGLVEIGQYAFYSNQLTSLITLEMSSPRILRGAFEDNKLTSVSIPGIRHIGESAFANNQITSISFNEDLNTLGLRAFYGNQLNSVIIPKFLKSITSFAFSNNLLTDVTFHDGVTVIKPGAFSNNRLTNVIFPSSLIVISESAFAGNQLTEAILPPGLESLGEYAFYDNQLTSVIIPNYIDQIANGIYSKNRLTSVKLHDQVSGIGVSAFADNLLTEVAIAKGVHVIFDSAFAGNPWSHVVFLGDRPNMNGQSFLTVTDEYDESNFIISYCGDNAGWPGENIGRVIPINDCDGDRVAFADDAFPNDSSEWTDSDSDGIGDNADSDDDNDGVTDIEDAFPLDATESVDTDFDGIGNNADTDDDNDGVTDIEDAFPLDASESIDTDFDGIGDNADTDDDNDGVTDIEDAFPLDASESVDTDFDGIGNRADTDDDNDGTLDDYDRFPLDASESVDTDSDGIGNNTDTDDDGDTVLDVDDTFPLDATESVDSDLDGVGDNADAFPVDPSETTDTDLDGIGNNADLDDDGDTISDAAEVANGTDPLLADTDFDGIRDNLDPLPLKSDESFAGNWVQMGSEILWPRSRMFKDISQRAVGVLGNAGTSLVIHGNDTTMGVFDWDSTTSDWTQRGPYISAESSDDWRNYAEFSSDGNTVAISANGNDDYDAGHVRVFDWDGAAWTQRGLDIDGETAGDRSGLVSMTADGKTLAIGGGGNDGNGEDAGHVRVFDWDGVAWTQRGLDIDGEAAGDISGNVSISSQGNTVAISAFLNDGNGKDAGHVRVFDWDGVAWTQRGLDIDGEAAYDQSGNVSISSQGNTVAIITARDRRHVRVFDWDGAAWVQRGLDLYGELGQRFVNVAISSDGNTLSIDASPAAFGYSSTVGSVLIFAWDGKVWRQRGQRIEGPPDMPWSISYKTSLSSDGTTVAIGEISYEEYVFEEYGIGSGSPIIGLYVRIFSLDSDLDGIGNLADNDDDGDGVDDATDNFPLDSTESLDTDSDGVGDNADAFPADPLEVDDTDLDGIGNNADLDDDGDTISDADEVANGTDPSLADTDFDGINDDLDPLPLTSAESFDGNWVQMGSGILRPQQTIPEGRSYHGSRGQLSSDGTSLVISDPTNTTVSIFDWDSTTSDWTQRGLDIRDESYRDQSAIIGSDGNTIAISALLSNGNAGHVRVFDWDGAAWVQRGLDIHGETAGDLSRAEAMSSNGNSLAIGGTGNDGNGEDAGHVRVFDWDGVAWTQRGLDIDGETAGDWSGLVSMTADGKTLAIGSTGNDGNGEDAGHVRVFDWDGVAWTQRGLDIDGEAAGDRSGNVSISSQGNTVAIRSVLNDGNGENFGHVRVFDWDGSYWTQRGLDIDGEAGLVAGTVSISSDGNTLSIGAAQGFDGSTDVGGSVRVFAWDGKAWRQRGLSINGPLGLGYSRSFIVSLSSNGATIAIGDLSWEQLITGVHTSDLYVRIFSLDSDLDGIGSLADTDDDGDGINDRDDVFPFDATEAVDTDLDGIGNNADTDDDNDGTPDGSDAFPLDSTETVDTDSDGIGNNTDTDDDNDGTPDGSDAFPLDSSETIDTDSDGTGNNTDTDDDNDGVPDSQEIADGTDPLDANSTDTDRDGVLDINDADDDGDGVVDSQDDFPLDGTETTDYDSDGIGDNADPDDDNDGVTDINDSFPFDATESLDTDSDGVGNNADDDDDGDGVPDEDDAFPLDVFESIDTDGDGLGNNSDPDDDGDGLNDEFDAFPLDINEYLDSDSDGMGDNSDAFPYNAEYTLDSDNDGMPDAWEAKYGLDPNDPSDATSDIDNDGVSALDEFLSGTIPSGSLDIDGNENYDALTDGLLLLRGMFGLDGSALVTGTVASDATYTESVDIESRIAILGDLADIDGNGEIDALTDGLLTLRYLFGLQGDTLINGVVAGDATRKTAGEIEAHLETLMPAL
jgi:hypothetical protein